MLLVLLRRNLICLCLFSLNHVFFDSSDSGEEGVLNALWQKYESGIDKVPG